MIRILLFFLVLFSSFSSFATITTQYYYNGEVFTVTSNYGDPRFPSSMNLNVVGWSNGWLLDNGGRVADWGSWTVSDVPSDQTPYMTCSDSSQIWDNVNFLCIDPPIDDSPCDNPLQIRDPFGDCICGEVPQDPYNDLTQNEWIAMCEAYQPPTDFDNGDEPYDDSQQCINDAVAQCNGTVSQVMCTIVNNEWTNVSTCLLPDTGQCGDGQTWDLIDQSCLTDTDGDNVADAYDPAPDNSGISGDSDGDGLRDEVDDFPNNPNEQFDATGNGVGNNEYLASIGQGGNSFTYTPSPVTNPVGPVTDPTTGATLFDDSSIVEGINGSNSLLADLSNKMNQLVSTGQQTNQGIDNLRADVNSIGDTLSGFNSSVNPSDYPVESGTNLTDIENSFDLSISQATDTLNKSFEELGGTMFSGSDIAATADIFQSFESIECVNQTVTIGAHSLSPDFCSNAERIRPYLYWLMWFLLSIGIWHEFNNTFRGN